MLYKRAFRKEKEVVTSLIKAEYGKMLLRKIEILIFNLAIEPCPCQSEASEWALVKGQAVCSLATGTGKRLVQTGRRGKESVIYGENQLSGLAKLLPPFQ